MNTMTLPLPTSARGASEPSAPAQPARADKPARPRDSAPTRETQGADKQGDTRFNRALKQAHEDEPQAERADGQAPGTPATTVDVAATAPAGPAIDPTLSSLWMSTALPQAVSGVAQDTNGTQDPSSADGNTLGAATQPLSDLVEGGTASPLALPLGLAMTTVTLPRQAAPGNAATHALPQTKTQTPDALEAAGLTVGPINTASSTASGKATSQANLNTSAPVTEQRPAASSMTLQAQPAWATVMADTTQVPSANSSSTTLTLPATTPTQWREPLLNALGERVQWQLQRGQEQAVIRLEPPNLGRVEIHIRHEAGGLQVHLNATHRDVVQQLQGVSDQLRSELSLRHAGDVAVAVADQGRDADARQRGRGQGGEQEQGPGRALSEAESTSQPRSAFTLAGSTVDKA